MFETVVDVLRQPLAVFGVSGLLIGIGVIISDRRRYMSGTPEPQQPDTTDAEGER